MQEINASEFRQKCLALLEDLPTEGILVTKHGRPVARVIPVRASSGDLIGSVPSLEHSPDDDLFRTDIEWHAQS